MELRIYCKKGNCQNMLRREISLGRRIKDILYVHGWIEQPGIGPVCTNCLNMEFEKTHAKQTKNNFNLY